MEEKKVRKAVGYFKELSIKMRERGFSGASEHCDLAIEALEKQLPKEAKKIDIIDPVTYQTNGRFYLCKCCEESCSEYMEYCPGCGQKLDWSEEES